MSHHPDPSFDPAEALALIHRTRSNLAAHVGTPRWYAPLYGLGTGAMIAAHALPPPYGLIGSMIALLLVLLMYRHWTRTSGTIVGGYRQGRTLPVTLALLVAVMAIGGGALALRYGQGLWWAPLVAGAILAPVAGVASHVWDRIWLAEMERLP